jgi:primary-amine oxidase
MLNIMSLLNKPAFHIVMLFCLLANVQAAPNPTGSCNGVPLRTEFSSGVAWSMCVSLDSEEGLVVNNVKNTIKNLERRILSRASLSQSETVFDDNRTRPNFMVTRDGLGSNKLITLSTQDCPNGKLYPDSTGRKVICARSQEDGLLYKYAYEAYRQGSLFEVFSISQANDFQTYTQRWRFYENGIIEPAIGFGGKIPRFASDTLGFGRAVTDSNSWALGFSSYLGWRLDFDLGNDANNDVAEEITSTPSASRRQKTLRTEVIATEAARNLDPEIKRTWRVKDGNEVNESGLAISYEIAPGQYYQSANNVRGRPWLNNDIYFTRYHECERYASDNNEAACPKNLLAYIQNKEPIEKSDLVVWYKQSYHYLPRSDDSDFISTDWVSFQLIPRDWNGSNPL